MDLSEYSKAERLDLLASLQEKKRRQDAEAWKYIPLYDWQKRFANKTSEYRECMLMAANRIGKTYTGVYIDAIHALGEYPDWWEGHRFKAPPLVWMLGYSGEKIRDILQTPLVGTLNNGEFSGGIIPKERVLDYIPMLGTSRCAKEIMIKRSCGGVSRIQFWSYTQGQHALMGDSLDWFHIDEEPKDKTIHPQILTRTATGDNGRGGRGILTMTPENGRTELVCKFMDNPGRSQYMQRATWDDAPHLTDDTKQALLESYPAWQRAMRTKGEPLLGAGLIFDIDPETLKCQPFECPESYWLIDGMDFGWDHPQAHIQLWWDKDEDTFYLAHAYKESKQTADQVWPKVRSWAKDVPTAWPADGLQTEKGSAKQQMSYYRDEGWEMIGEHATWSEGGNGVEAGLVELYQLMSHGKFKVFSHLHDFFHELMNYHRDDNGKIAKVVDDILDAVRYAYMMRRYAIQKFELCQDKTHNVTIMPTMNHWN